MRVRSVVWVALLALVKIGTDRVPLCAAPLSPQQIYAKYSNGVVTVKTDKGSGTGFFWGEGLKAFGALGRVHTAYHVLEGCESATVILRDGTELKVTSTATADKDADIAELIVERAVDGPWFGDYAALQVGEPVTVIGSPLGLSQTVTTGIVSAKRQVGDKSYLQLSAGVSSGSSGSPVFNSKGEVVGMIISSLTDGQLLNFAFLERT